MRFVFISRCSLCSRGGRLTQRATAPRHLPAQQRKSILQTVSRAEPIARTENFDDQS